MAYRLIVTDYADELIDARVFYIYNRLKNFKAAKHLLDGIEIVYARLEDNPWQFPESGDEILKSRGYRDALIPEMDYKLVFRIEGEIVYIVGLFHNRENHGRKVPDLNTNPKFEVF